MYGGVSTWIINFIKMYEGDKDWEIVPIFLAYADKDTSIIRGKYKDIRIIYNSYDLSNKSKSTHCRISILTNKSISIVI